MAVHVVEPGLLTTIQDGGRWGFQHLGVPVAGPMDQVSYRLANLLVGNSSSEAALEVTVVGPRLVFEEESVFAVVGAPFDLRLGGIPVSMNTSQLATAGQQLSFGRCSRGARAYVAVAGGFVVPITLGSRATHLLSRMGGLDGRALDTGDRLVLGQGMSETARVGESRSCPFVIPDNGARVRVIAGPHNELFGDDMFKQLCVSRYLVSSESDRMGYRLQGTPVEVSRKCDVISSAVQVGSVQVLPSGQPIILMADHQTTGGYPQVATVISADVPIVAQLAPSAWVEFEACDLQDAIRALIAQERALMN